MFDSILEIIIDVFFIDRVLHECGDFFKPFSSSIELSFMSVNNFIKFGLVFQQNLLLAFKLFYLFFAGLCLCFNLIKSFSCIDYNSLNFLELVEDFLVFPACWNFILIDNFADIIFPK